MSAPALTRHRHASAITLVVSLALAGCAAVEPVSSPAPGASSAPVSPTPSEGGSPVTAGPGEPQVLASGLDVPWDLAVLPDGSALVTLRDRAEVIRIAPGKDAEVAGFIEAAAPAGEGGLLGIALSPDFDSDAAVYLYVSAEGDNRVLRYRYADGELTDPQVILDGIPRSTNHNGGRLRFGPDGMLYVGTGDAGTEGDAQDRASLAGKILRITAAGEVPADNPFDNQVWSYGHRNVQGFGWDDAGRMFASEFGSNRLDELNLIEAGRNYGWPDAEGPSDNPDFTDPLVSWPTSDASPSGIAVSGDGEVFIASLRGERLWRTAWEGDAMTDPEVWFDGVGRLRAVELVGDQLWLLTNNTARGNPSADDDRLLAIQAP